VVPHDAREPTQFVFRHNGISIGVVSDLGSVTPYVVEQFSGLNGILMESNYDEVMLVRGRYPERVKRRIASRLGHLSNDQAAAFLGEIAHPELQVVVGHVSQENNHPDLLAESFSNHEDGVRSLVFASQEEGADWSEVGPADAGLTQAGGQFG